MWCWGFLSSEISHGKTKWPNGFIMIVSHQRHANRIDYVFDHLVSLVAEVQGENGRKEAKCCPVVKIS